MATHIDTNSLPRSNYQNRPAVETYTGT